MNTNHISDLPAATLLAAQIVFEYPDWGSEHCDEMIKSYYTCGDTPPCGYDDLYSLCNRIEKYKNKGHNFDVCVEKVIEDLE